MDTDPVLQSLKVADDAAPNDVPLRMHYAEMLGRAGERDAAVQQAAD